MFSAMIFACPLCGAEFHLSAANTKLYIFVDHPHMSAVELSCLSCEGQFEFYRMTYYIPGLYELGCEFKIDLMPDETRWARFFPIIANGEGDDDLQDDELAICEMFDREVENCQDVSEAT